MILLIVSYGTGFSGACLIEDGKVIGSNMENEPAQGLPRAAIDQVLSDGGIGIDKVDYIVFLGKPLLYLERLIDTHVKLFPFSFIKFFRDFNDFFANKFRIRSILKKNLGFRKDVCYCEVADAVAYGISREAAPEAMSIAVLLSDSISFRIGGLYRCENGSLVLNKEVTHPSRPFSFEDMLRPLKNDLCEAPFHGRTIIASDLDPDPNIKEDLRRKAANLSFQLLSDYDILKYVGRYVSDGIK